MEIEGGGEPAPPMQSEEARPQQPPSNLRRRRNLNQKPTSLSPPCNRDRGSSRSGTMLDTSSPAMRTPRATAKARRPELDHPTLSARTSAARSLTGITGSSPGLFTGRLRR